MLRLDEAVADDVLHQRGQLSDGHSSAKSCPQANRDERLSASCVERADLQDHVQPSRFQHEGGVAPREGVQFKRAAAYGQELWFQLATLFERFVLTCSCSSKSVGQLAGMLSARVQHDSVQPAKKQA